MTEEIAKLRSEVEALRATTSELQARLEKTNSEFDAFGWATITWIHQLASQDMSLLQAVHMAAHGKNFRTNDELRKRLLHFADVYNDAKNAMDANRPTTEEGGDA